MNAQDAKLLTLETGMKLVDHSYAYEMWEGEIFYRFVPSLCLDTTIDDIMNNSRTLCVWMDPNGNGIVSSKI